MRHLLLPFNSRQLGYVKGSGFNRADYYYLYTDFLTADPNPVASPYAAEVGSLTVVDPASVMSINANGLEWATFRNGNQVRSITPMARGAGGLACYNKIKLINNGAGTDSIGAYIGFFDSSHSLPRGATRLRILPGTNVCQAGFAASTLLGSGDWDVERALTDGIDIELMTVLSPLGSRTWIKGGTSYPNLTLLGSEYFNNNVTLHYHMDFSNGFDATYYGCRFRNIRVAKPVSMWSNDFLGAQQISTVNGTIATMASVEDTVAIYVTTICTTGSLQYQFRYTDANNYAYIEVLPNGANNTIRLMEVRLGAAAVQMATTTAVAGDVVSIQRNNPASNTRRNRFIKNAAIVSSPAAVATSPVGTGIRIVNTSNGSFTLRCDPKTVTEPAILTYFANIAAGVAL